MKYIATFFVLVAAGLTAAYLLDPNSTGQYLALLNEYMALLLVPLLALFVIPITEYLYYKVDRAKNQALLVKERLKNERLVKS